MNKIIITFSIVILIIAGGFIIYQYNQLPVESTNQNPSVQGPQIKVDSDSFDFGTVIYGDVVEHSFTITNSGNQPLEILRLSTSCGCTQAHMAESDQIIAPGQSVPMRVTFDPAVHKDDSDLGNLTRIVYIKTNDPVNPEIEVVISALVIKE